MEELDPTTLGGAVTWAEGGLQPSRPSSSASDAAAERAGELGAPLPADLGGLLGGGAHVLGQRRAAREQACAGGSNPRVGAPAASE